MSLCDEREQQRRKSVISTGSDIKENIDKKPENLISKLSFTPKENAEMKAEKYNYDLDVK